MTKTESPMTGLIIGWTAPLSFGYLRSSTLTFSEALPLLNTPKFRGGSAYPSAVNELTPTLEKDYAHREPIFSDVCRGETVHQCKACWDLLLLLLIGGPASRIVLSFFPSCRARLLSNFSWVHNLPFFALAFSSVCKPCRVRKTYRTIGRREGYILARCSSSASLLG